MVSIHLIQRHFEAQRYESLLELLCRNGLDLPLPLRVRLSQSPEAAIALGLRRLMDLTYGPTAASRAMVERLLSMQLPDGSFSSDPVATAAVLAGLAKFQSEQRRDDGEMSQQAAQCLERAMAALSAFQRDDGLFYGQADRTEQDAAMGSALAIWLLADHAGFRAAVRYADLLSWFEHRHAGLDADVDRLWSVARVGAAAAKTTSPAVAAIAA